MKKVLFLIEDFGCGGAERVLCTLLNNIDTTKYDITVCSITGGGELEIQLPSTVTLHTVQNHVAGDNIFRSLLYRIKYHFIYHWLPMWAVYFFFIPKGSDIEIAFVEGFATKVIAASCNQRAKKIAWVHIDLHKFHWTRSVFKSDVEEEKAYNSFDQIVAVSKTAEEAINKEFQIQVPVRTVYNPIDADEIIRMSKDPLDIPQGDRVRLVSVGRLNKQKAYGRLLRIIKRLKDDGIACELWLLGEGGDRTMLEQYIRENALADEVKLWGFHSNPYNYLAQCDLFVCSSISEGFSTAITEALILGMPVVSTEVSGVREQLTNGCGIITDNNEEALYQGLKIVLENPEKLKEMRAKAIVRGKDFLLESLMKEIEIVLS